MFLGFYVVFKNFSVISRRYLVKLITVKNSFNANVKLDQNRSFHSNCEDRGEILFSIYCLLLLITNPVLGKYKMINNFIVLLEHLS